MSVTDDGERGLPSITGARLMTPSRSTKTARHAAVDSHFVAVRLIDGCETIRCQRTAWNASACGVTVAGLTTGTTTHASATADVKPPSRPTIPRIDAPTRCAY